jgi:UDP-N-acetylmuramyl-tripeptide synthetase
VGGAISEETVVTDMVIDSRQVSPDALFVALEGAEADGHDYIEEAIESGACAVLAEASRVDTVQGTLNADRVEDIEWLAADDTRRWLGPLASAFFEHPSEALLVIGITGTNGKTTTSFILESLLKRVGVETGLVGTVVNRWPGVREQGPNTTPESLTLHRWMAQMREAGVDAVVLEVSSHALETQRLGGVDIDVGVLTNLSQDHLDFHGSMEAYRRAKARLFTDVLPWSRTGASGRKTLAGEPTAVLNLDDAFGRRLQEKLEDGTDRVTYGLESPEATWRATIRSQSLVGSRIDIQAGSRRATVEWPLLGRFNVSNALAAGAAAMAAGAGFHDIVRGLESVEPVPGRLQRVEAEVDSAPTVFVDYAHSPEAVEHVLETLRPLTSGRLIGLLGCGGDRDADKRPQMGRVLAEETDVAVFTSDNPRSESPEAIIDAMLRGARDVGDSVVSDFPEGAGMWVEVDREAAIDEAIERARAEDVVLIAGKGHETYQEIAGGRRPFDDVDRARRALEAHHA